MTLLEVTIGLIPTRMKWCNPVPMGLIAPQLSLLYDSVLNVDSASVRSVDGNNTAGNSVVDPYSTSNDDDERNHTSQRQNCF